jgi:hypothetical protein
MFTPYDMRLFIATASLQTDMSGSLCLAANVTI